MRGEFVDIGGARIYCFAAGNRGAGEPIIFLHGFPTSSYLWREVTPLVPAGHRMLVLDMLGYGRSDPAGPHPVSASSHARRLLALMDMFGIDRACIAGHDVGAAAALILATMAGDRVTRLLLVDPAWGEGWRARSIQLLRKQLPLLRHLPATTLIRLVQRATLAGYSDQEAGKRSLEHHLRSFTGARGRASLVAQLRAIDCEECTSFGPELATLTQPVAIVQGADAPAGVHAASGMLQEAIPQATLHVIPSIGCFAPEEAPAAVTQVLNSLLSA